MPDRQPTASVRSAGIVTATLAELYATQGHTRQALEMFGHLSRARPGDEQIARRVAELTIQRDRERRRAALENRIERLKTLLRRVRRRRRGEKA